MESYLIDTCFNRKTLKAEISDVPSENSEFKFKLGIIDFLTNYNTAKKFETTLNTVLHWNDRNETSC